MSMDPCSRARLMDTVPYNPDSGAEIMLSGTTENCVGTPGPWPGKRWVWEATQESLLAAVKCPGVGPWWDKLWGLSFC